MGQIAWMVQSWFSQIVRLMDLIFAKCQKDHQHLVARILLRNTLKSEMRLQIMFWLQTPSMIIIQKKI